MVPTTERITELAHTTSAALEVVAILVIVLAVLIAAGRALKWVLKNDSGHAYASFKETFGRGLLLGLEILVAADLLWTVAVEPTWENLGALALLVLIRTFLSWSLEVELEGHWPWHRHKIETEECRSDEG